MWDAVESGVPVSDEEWAEAVPGLRVDLLNAQFDLRQANFSVVLVLVGDDRDGVVEVLHRLNEWLDARYLVTRVFVEPEPEEQLRPLFWRYWRSLPPKGRIGLYVGAWPLGAVAGHLNGSLDEAGFEQRLHHIENFERTLAEDGTLVLKFWIHRKGASNRKKKKNKGKNGALVSGDWTLLGKPEPLLELSERLIQRTSQPSAPWRVVDGGDDHTRDLSVARILAQAVTARLGDGEPPVSDRAVDFGPVPDALGNVDLSASIDREDYEKRKKQLQERVNDLAVDARKQGVPSVLVFEGWDAAGKGGCIRRITQALNPRDVAVVPIQAPSDEESARHYLWRFWRRLPRNGRMLIFDRSWYGRVLVERVEGFAREDEWRRAYDEINDFEAQLVEHGVALGKFWLHIDPDTQLARFRAREKTPYKKYKITDEDYRNRERWDDYTSAVNEMLARTHTSAAPWRVVSSNQKRWARIQVLEAVCAALEERLKG